MWQVRYFNYVFELSKMKIFKTSIFSFGIRSILTFLLISLSMYYTALTTALVRYLLNYCAYIILLLV